jgi:hypothetical protein
MDDRRDDEISEKSMMELELLLVHFRYAVE